MLLCKVFETFLAKILAVLLLHVYIYRYDPFLRMISHEITASNVQVAVVLGSGINMRELYELVVTTNSTIQHWLLAGMDTEDDFLPNLFSPDHPVILFRKSDGQVPVFNVKLEEMYEFSENIKNMGFIKSYVDYMNKCRKDIGGNGLNDSQCSDQIRHSNLQKTMVEESVDQLFKNVMECKYLFLIVILINFVSILN